jgi:hypothetical protein
MAHPETTAPHVRLGLTDRPIRQPLFSRRLVENLANEDPNQQDRLVDEFRALILGRCNRSVA